MNVLDKDQIRDAYLNALQHAFIAYRYFASSIPTGSMFVSGQSVHVGRFEFRTPADALSMRVELGWAFFTRMEASLEVFIHRLGIKLSHQKGLCQYLHDNGVQLDANQKNGLNVYREIRNSLHHGDGDPALLSRKPKFLVVEEGHEPHLLEHQIESFYELFVWLGEVLPDTVSG